MTSTQEQFVDFAQRGQETLIKAVREWADTAQAYTRTFAAAQPELPAARDVVNNVFDFAEQVLRSQRELATSLVAAGAEVAEATRAATEQASQQAAAAAQRAVAEAKAATSRVAGQD
ncbi:MAG TPA: hypothetical protein VH008_11270 [Pseudonocardia sp.]|jgi:hypothetical protein|nr:hypothetical protein [Pseudonocardia sp.]